MSHTCHWPGCKREVPPAMWGCKPHWMRLPMAIRRKIWATYRPGQEIDKNPSEEYLKAAKEAQDWIARYDGMPPFVDIAGPNGLPEDERILLIGSQARQGIVGLLLEKDEPEKIERYKAKIAARFPDVKFIDQSDGPVPTVVLLRFCPKATQ